MVARESRALPPNPQVTARPGQRTGEPQPSQPVHLSAGPLGASDTTDGGTGLLSALPQQVQPDRALLARAGGLLEWGAAQQRRRGAGLRGEHDLCRETSATGLRERD